MITALIQASSGVAAIFSLALFILLLLSVYFWTFKIQTQRELKDKANIPFEADRRNEYDR